MTRLMLIGGFLGAGKTTLIAKLAEKLRGHGKKIGIVTNDQAPSLVDTVFLAKSNKLINEVSGSCFCCNYNGFIKAVGKLIADGANHILAEPVGSCTDLSATILQPIKNLEKNKFNLEAFSALIDPECLQTLLNNGNAGFNSSVLYIIRKQLEEADIIILTKKDKFDQEIIDSLIERTKTAFPDRPVLAVSALTGEGLENLLKTIESVKYPGAHLTEVNYDTYAEGEAILGWLNMETVLQKKGADWHAFAKKFLSAIASSFAKEKIAIAHVKLFMEGSKSQIIGNIVGENNITVKGSLSDQESTKLILNARAQTSPENLLKRVKVILSACCKEDEVTHETKIVNCLMPGRPNPTHHYSTIVK